VDVVVEGTLTSLFVSLEEKEIGLARNGDTFRFHGSLNIDGPLNMVFHARGIAFSAWKLAITLGSASEPQIKRSGLLDLSNEVILKEAIPLPAAAEALATEAIAAVRAMAAGKSAGRKSARKSSRKSSRKSAGKRGRNK
jgi:hypothetical protein